MSNILQNLPQQKQFQRLIVCTDISQLLTPVFIYLAKKIYGNICHSEQPHIVYIQVYLNK